MTLQNLNPDVTGIIKDTLGVRGDPAAPGLGSFSLISLIKRGLGLLMVPSQAKQSRVVLPPNTSSVLVDANTITKEVLIYNVGLTSVAVCLGITEATYEDSSYLLGSRILVVESFSGVISAISRENTELIVTVKS